MTTKLLPYVLAATVGLAAGIEQPSYAQIKPTAEQVRQLKAKQRVQQATQQDKARGLDLYEPFDKPLDFANPYTWERGDYRWSTDAHYADVKVIDGELVIGNSEVPFENTERHGCNVELHMHKNWPKDPPYGVIEFDFRILSRNEVMTTRGFTVTPSYRLRDGRLVSHSNYIVDGFKSDLEVGKQYHAKLWCLPKRSQEKDTWDRNLSWTCGITVSGDSGQIRNRQNEARRGWEDDYMWSVRGVAGETGDHAQTNSIVFEARDQRVAIDNIKLFYPKLE